MLSPSVPPPPTEDLAEGDRRFRRPLRETIRRHGVLLLAVICLLSSAILWMWPLLGRTYDASGSTTISVRPFDPLPELTRFPEAALKQFRRDPAIQATLASEGRAMTLLVKASAPQQHQATGKVRGFIQDFERFLEREVRAFLDTHRSQLTRQLSQLNVRLVTLEQKKLELEATGGDIRAEGPGSPADAFQKLSGRLEEQEQRVRVLAELLNKLRTQKKALLTRGAQAPAIAALTPPPPAAAATVPPAGAASKPENDPEVMALNAQLQLVNSQIEEQLRTRTEQHPYVQDLRTQEVNLKKKLEAARQRAATGAPAPAVVNPLAPAPVMVDPTLAAVENVDRDIAVAEAEHDTLRKDNQLLIAQRDALREKVDRALQMRREEQRIAAELLSAANDKKGLEAQIKTFDQYYSPEATGALPNGINLKEPPVEVGEEVTFAATSRLPRWPSLPLVYGSGLLAGLLAAGGLALLLNRADRTFHHANEVGGLLQVPVLGMVSEIRTPGERLLRRLWRSVARPMLAVAFVLVMLASAVQCYRHLANPGFPQDPRLLSLGETAMPASTRVVP